MIELLDNIIELWIVTFRLLHWTAHICTALAPALTPVEFQFMSFSKAHGYDTTLDNDIKQYVEENWFQLLQ